VLGLDALADVTPGNIESYFSLHTVPPKLLLQVLVHFGTSRMNGIWGLMGFLQNELLQLIDARGAQAAIIPYHTFLVN
jgi:hypothetical protein